MNNTGNSIKVLDDSVIEKISAGEVVERPSSVVKELIENAIDAKATRIEVEVNDGGLSLIKVSDNGSGIASEDMEISLMRHATSKIEDYNDLQKVYSLGFRGEALASISAVSVFTLISSKDDSGLGKEIQCRAGKIMESKPASRTRGTTVECRDLFFNVPARKKFLKTVRAEKMAVARLIENVALPFPSIHFVAVIDGKKRVDLPAVGSLRDRISQVAGTGFADSLLKCDIDEEGIEAVLFINRPEDSRSRPRFQNLYVNLRYAVNDQVRFGIKESFRRFIASEYNPSWFCFLTIDPVRIDCNVHPAKRDIKFEDEKSIFKYVYRMVRNCVNSQMPSADDTRIFENSEKKDVNLSRNRENGQGFYGLRENLRIYRGSSGDLARSETEQQTSISFMSPVKGEEEEYSRKGKDYAMELSEEWGIIPCYQIHKTYILAQIKNGIILIDQHAAHERVLFEKAVEDLRGGAGGSQRLLFPEIFEFSKMEKSILLEGRDTFDRLGFEMQDFGGDSIAVSSIPAVDFLNRRSIEETIREVLYYLIDDKANGKFSQAEKKYAAAFACGAAIKSGDKLEREEMNSLLNSLFAAENPYTCPHGRPTIVRISINEIERRFLRK